MTSTGSQGNSIPAARFGGGQAIVEVHRGQTVVAQGVKSETFVLRTPRADVADFAHEGNNLIVEFKDGSRLRIDNFFVHGNQLALVDGGQVYQANFPKTLGHAGSDGSVDERVQLQPVSNTDAGISTQTLLTILGIGAGIAIIASSGHSTGSSAEAPPAPATPAAPTTPAAPASYADGTGSIRNAHSTAPVTDETRPGINIPALGSGQTASLYVDGKKIIANYNPQAGTLTPVAALPEGKHSITYTVTGANGKESAPSGPLTITIVTTPPPAPTLAAAEHDGSVTGPIGAGSSTGDVRPAFSGTGAAGTTITLHDGATTLGTAVVQSNGQWSLTPATALANGAHSITATATDPAGNTSIASAALTFTVKTTAPSISIDVIAGDDVVNQQESGAVTISGHTTSVEDGQSVKLTFSDGAGHSLSATAQVKGGAWSANAVDLSTLSDGDITITANVADKAGHTAQNTRHASLDTTASISIDTPIPGDYVVEMTTGIATAIARISGTTKGVEDGQSVTLTFTDSAGHQVKASATVNGGQWSAELKLSNPADGDATFTAEVSDQAGNSALNSQHENLSTFSLGMPQVDPSADTTTDTTLGGGTVAMPADDSNDASPLTRAMVQVAPNHVATNDPSATLVGTATPNTKVTVSSDGVVVGTTMADTAGNWRFTLPALSEADHDIQVLAQNAAGTYKTASIVLTVDLTPHAVPVLDQVLDGVGPIQGALHSGDYTDDNAPTLSGKGATPGDQIKVYDGAIYLGSATVDSSGHWSYKPAAPLIDGPHNLQVSSLSPVANESAKSPAFNITVDTVAPDKQAFEAIDSVGTITGPIGPGNPVTDDSRPVFKGNSGASEASTIITIYDVYDGVSSVLGSTTVQADGSWSFRPANEMNDGGHSVTVKATDKAGNESQVSNALAFTTNTEDVNIIIKGIEDHAGNTMDNLGGGNTNPAAPSISIDTPIAGNDIVDATENTHLVIAGTTAGIEPGQFVTVTFTDSANHQVSATGQVGADHRWSIPALDLSGLSSGDVTVTAHASDKAGNSAESSYHVSLMPPGLPTISIDTIAGDDVIDASEITAVVISGHTTGIEDGQTVEIAVAFKQDGYSSSITLPSEVQTVGVGGGGILMLHAQVTGGVWKTDPVDLSDLPVKEYGNSADLLSVNDIGITARVSDSSGNSAQAVHHVTVDPALIPVLPSISIDTIAGDDVINVQEADALTISGHVTNAADGQSVTVVILSGTFYDGTNAHYYTAQVNGGAWSTDAIDLSTLPDGQLTVIAGVLDKTGTMMVQSQHGAVLDTTPLPVAPGISIDAIAGNDVVNAQESAALTISGKTANVEDGQTVTVTIGNGIDPDVTLTATVSGGAWSTSAVDLSKLTGGELTVTAGVSDKAGATAQSTHHATLDTFAAISIDTPIAGDDIIDATEGSALIISGHAAGVEDGQIVTVELSVKVISIATSAYATPDSVTVASVSAQVIGGVWVTGPIDLSALPADMNSNDITVTARVSDKAGNLAQDSHHVTADGTLMPVWPTISIDSVADGDVINAQQAHALIISGHTTSVEDGQTVTVAIGNAFPHDGPDMTVTAQVSGGTWSTDPIDVSSLADGAIFVLGSVLNRFGAIGTNSHFATLDTSGTALPPDLGTVTITDYVDAVAPVLGKFGNDSHTNDASPLLEGTVSHLQAGGVVQIFDGSKYLGNAAIGSDGSSWTFKLNGLADGMHTLTGKVVDAAGIGGAISGTFGFTVDTIAPAKQSFQAIDNVGEITGPIGPNNIITDDSQPVFKGNSGSSEAGTIITVYDVYNPRPLPMPEIQVDGSLGVTPVNMPDGTPSVLGTATVQADGSWTFKPTVEMPDGAHGVTVKATDKAGNESVVSDPLVFYTDTPHAIAGPITSGTVSIEKSMTANNVIDGVENTGVAADGQNATQVNDQAGHATQGTGGTTAGTALASTGANGSATLGTSHDTPLIKLLASSDASGDSVGQVNGLTPGAHGETPHTGRIDLSQLLTGYTPAAADGSAHHIAGKTAIHAGDTAIGDYLKVTNGNGNTVDSAGTAFSETPLITHHGVETDLATLLANHQIAVSHG